MKCSNTLLFSPTNKFSSTPIFWLYANCCSITYKYPVTSYIAMLHTTLFASNRGQSILYLYSLLWNCVSAELKWSTYAENDRVKSYSLTQFSIHFLWSIIKGIIHTIILLIYRKQGKICWAKHSRFKPYEVFLQKYFHDALATSFYNLPIAKNSWENFCGTLENHESLA